MTVIDNYKDGLQQLIEGSITRDAFQGHREQMLLALCRGIAVDDATRQELKSLEQQAGL